MQVLKAERIKIEDSLDEINNLFHKNQWTDGLPIIPPTEDRVLKMLEGTSREPDELIGLVPVRQGELRVEDIAINAVMAGCLPEYMPVIIAVIEAMLELKFNLFGVQATTHPAAPLVIVNGPVAKKLNINSGSGCFGPGWRANATIGRAIRLILWNVGGGIAGKGDMSTQGRPSKFSYCIAENEDANPWEPLHVERGFEKEASTITVFACDTPHNINDHVSTTALGILNTIAYTMANVGTNQAYASDEDLFLVLGPEHAASIAADGFSKDDVKRFIYENARIPARIIKDRGMYGSGVGLWPKWFNEMNENALIPIIQEWQKVIVLVAGGIGKHSCWLPNCGMPATITREIKEPAL
jgi:hypothetical protein